MQSTSRGSLLRRSALPAYVVALVAAVVTIAVLHSQVTSRREELQWIVANLDQELAEYEVEVLAVGQFKRAKGDYKARVAVAAELLDRRFHLPSIRARALNLKVLELATTEDGFVIIVAGPAESLPAFEQELSRYGTWERTVGVVDPAAADPASVRYVSRAIGRRGA